MSVESAQAAVEDALVASKATAAEVQRIVAESWRGWANEKTRTIVAEQAVVTNDKSPAELSQLKRTVEAAITDAEASIPHIYADLTDSYTVLNSPNMRGVAFDKASSLTRALWAALEGAGYKLYSGSTNWSNLTAFPSSEVQFGPLYYAAVKNFHDSIERLDKAERELSSEVRDAAQARAASAWDEA
ncbi:hypothetical protein ACI2IX_16440 [Leifsonia aquatica]|uniref:hypothetical protein n=1 Tax=Leifsonia aquatica TaxID=144185 RepID=UPI00384CDB0F